MKKDKVKKPKVKKTRVLVDIPDLLEYVGRTVVINRKKVKIKTIVGNLGLTLGRRPEDRRPQFAEINGEHRISFLRFFAQMNGEHYTEEEYKAFDDMQVWAEQGAIDPNVQAAKTIVDKIMETATQEERK